MKAWVVPVVLACAGCKSDESRVRLRAPTVTVPTVLASGLAKPPVVALVDDAGRVELLQAASWSALDANRLTAAKLADMFPASTPRARTLDNAMLDPGSPVAPTAGTTERFPARGAEIAGVVMYDGRIDPPPAMVVVSPTTKALRLITVVRSTGGAIAVYHAGKVRPLRIQFQKPNRDAYNRYRYWLEARVSSSSITVEAVPDAPIEVTDLGQLATALETARKTRGAPEDIPIDVLVDPAVDAQRLIDVLVMLDGVATVVGLGPELAPDELALRGKRVPRMSVGQPNVQGDLDKKEIRTVVNANKDNLLACYTKLLPENPNLSGTVQAQFFITPQGTVASASASGVHPQLATCVADLVKGFVFPKPHGGGGVMVNYPFTMRP